MVVSTYPTNINIILWVDSEIYKLVGGMFQPLWKMMEWKSVGMMKFLAEWKNKIHVPNHQQGNVTKKCMIVYLTCLLNVFFLNKWPHKSYIAYELYHIFSCLYTHTHTLSLGNKHGWVSPWGFQITYGYVWKFDASEMRRLAHFFPPCFYVDPENCHKMGDVNPQLW